MKLRHSPKIYGQGVHRVVSAEDTYERVRHVARKIGVTRLADITGLDRIGISVYSAIMPKSNDVVSVYNGKGLRPIDAKVGAIMESIERYAAWSYWPPNASGSFQGISSRHLTLDPREIIVELQEDYTDHTEIDWSLGFDLIQGEPILVPHYAAAYFNEPPSDRHLCYRVTSANGLASGNTIEEAICHALCEIVERDAWTLAELTSRTVPLHLRNTHPEIEPELLGDDLETYPSIDLSSLKGPARTLVEIYQRAGIRPVLRDVTSDIGIATILCCIGEDLVPSFSPAHAGIGSHPDAMVAVTRALTEAAQARAVDIQGLREDISMADEEVDKAFLHSKRVPKTEGPNFYQTESSHPVLFDAVPTHPSNNILDDIRLILTRLEQCGFHRAIVVDLSAETLCSSVVRVIVPGLESWAAVKGKIGPRAERVMRETAAVRMTEAVARANTQRIMNAFFGGLPRAKS